MKGKENWLVKNAPWFFPFVVVVGIPLVALLVFSSTLQPVYQGVRFEKADILLDRGLVKFKDAQLNSHRYDILAKVDKIEVKTGPAEFGTVMNLYLESKFILSPTALPLPHEHVVKIVVFTPLDKDRLQWVRSLEVAECLYEKKLSLPVQNF